MRLPKFILPALLKLHVGAQKTPYYPIPKDGSYMERGWILGYRSPDRNGDNPRWNRSGFVRPDSSRLYRWVTKNIAIRAHTTKRSDKERHNHDHPSWNVSIVLSSGYFEVTERTERAIENPIVYRAILDSITQGWVVDGTNHEWFERYGIYWRGPGAIVFRKRDTPHRLILPPKAHCKSIFIVGPKEDGWTWGFYTEAGKVPWRKYLGLSEKEVA